MIEISLQLKSSLNAKCWTQFLPRRSMHNLAISIHRDQSLATSTFSSQLVLHNVIERRLYFSFPLFCFYVMVDFEEKVSRVFGIYRCETRFALFRPLRMTSRSRLVCKWLCLHQLTFLSIRTILGLSRLYWRPIPNAPLLRLSFISSINVIVASTFYTHLNTFEVFFFF